MEESQKLAEGLQAWVQLLVALTPLGAVLVKLIRDLRQRSRDREAAPAPGPLPWLTPAQRSADLALALAYAALFSLLWTYALGMSGRILEWRELTGVSLALTLLIGIALVLAWIHQRVILAVAGFALLSYLLLVIAPGGVFSSQNPQVPLPIYFLLVLTLIAATFLLYLRGHYPVLARRRRWAVPAILGVLCGLGAIVGGLQLTRSTFADNRAPLLGDEGRRLFRTLGNTSLASQRLFYQVASELALVPYYRAQHLAPPAEVAQGPRAAAADRPQGNRPSGDRPSGDVGESLLLGALDLPEPEVYMVNRLRWVHPLGTANDLKASVSMPGPSAEDRLKSAFEVPGVYYYLSLAEDAFGALYLGAVDGKNEIDSSFDHVVRVRPLDPEEATEVVAAQCRQIGLRLAGPRLARAVAAVTFGVPRDAFRLCGELATQSDEITTAGVVRALRNRRELEARLAYELRRIAAPLAEGLSGRANACRMAARQLLTGSEKEARSPAASRVALSCWLLAMVEEALEIPAEALWREVSARCADLGGQVALIPLEDVISRATEIDATLEAGAEPTLV